MKRFSLLLCLAGCGAQPTPTMFGAERFDVTKEGRSYVIFKKENMVEVIRLGYVLRGEHQTIRATMIELVEPTTGCHLVQSTLRGDSGEMRGKINCPKRGGG